MKVVGGLFLAPFLAACLACGPVAPDAVPTPPTNLVLVSLCSVRADHTSLYGYARTTTPTLQSLGRSSIVFDQAVTQWPKTTPAFASLFTGQYGHTHGVMRITGGQRLGESHRTLAQILQDHGYSTAAFVSSPALSRDTGLQRGFAVSEETFRDREPFRRATEDALHWLSHRAEAPFFLWVHYNNAHQPYGGGGAPPDLFVDDANYDPRPKVPLLPGTPLDLAVMPDHPFRTQIVRPDMGGVRPSAVLPERPTELSYYVARYDAGIRAADDLIAELLQGIGELGLLDRTVLAVVGDHGEALGGHGYYFGHGRLPYEDVLRVPMVVRLPGHGPRRVEAPVPTFALAPTLLEALGLAPPHEMESHSLLPSLEGREPTPVFSESGYQIEFQVTLRIGRWKLIHVPDEIDRALMTGSAWELYDLRRDPAELHDYHGTGLAVEKALREKLLTWVATWRPGLPPPRPLRPPADSEVRRGLRDLGYLD